MTRPIGCTTPGVWCFCCAVFFLAYGVGLVAMAIWPGLIVFQETLLLVALAITCFTNYGCNRTYHCRITGPLFLAAALVVGLGEAGLVDVDVSLVWGVVMVGLGIAVLLEVRYAWMTKPLERRQSE